MPTLSAQSMTKSLATGEATRIYYYLAICGNGYSLLNLSLAVEGVLLRYVLDVVTELVHLTIKT
jgi:hypothetical protein